MRGIFVIGTDTGVGKTVITAALARLLIERGIDTGVIKPVQSGAVSNDPTGDAALLARWSGVTEAPSAITRYAFAAPLAPLIAAELEGLHIERNELVAHVEAISRRHDAVVIEGAGGLLVPLGPNWTLADLAARLSLPVLLVARAGLGTVNHTALTVEACRTRRLHVIGVVCNTTAPIDASNATNPRLIEELTGVPVLGTMPLLEGELDGPRLALALSEHVDIDPIIRTLQLETHEV